jgi:antitoxin VapB
MTDIAKARVFMSGRSQAVRIPAEFRFASSEVYIRRNPESGEITLSERPPQPSLAKIFEIIDEAGGAPELMDEVLKERQTDSLQERPWF